MSRVTKQRVQHADSPQLRDVNAAQRVEMAIKLRAHKMTYADIAKTCGYGSPGAAHKAVQRELERVVVTNVDELRHEESVTLDMLQTECMKLFLDKDNRARLFAADRLLAIMDRRAKLFGLDAQKDGSNNTANMVVVREAPHGLIEMVKK